MIVCNITSMYAMKYVHNYTVTYTQLICWQYVRHREREMIKDLPRKCPKQTENWLPKCWHSFYHCFPPLHPRKRSKMTQHVAAHPTPLKPRLNPIESDGPTHGHRVPHGACYRWHPGAGKLNSVPGRWAQNSKRNMSTKHFDGVWIYEIDCASEMSFLWRRLNKKMKSI